MAENSTKSRVLLLVSGGPDSATLAKLAEQERKADPQIQFHAVYLKSGHPSDTKEIEAANYVIQQLGGRLEIIDISRTVSALGSDRVMIHSEAALMPFGNGLALSIAIVYALKTKCERILVGIHADDATECNEYNRDFFDKMENAAGHAHDPFPRIDTPLLEMTKRDVFELGLRLGVDFAKTWSCIRGQTRHCGDCGACRARHRAFEEVYVTDPTDYETEPLALETAVH